MHQKEGCPIVGHSAKKKSDKRTDTHTTISIGDHHKKLLVYLLSLDSKNRFNLKRYSRNTGKPRGTIYHWIDKLISEGLIEKPHDGNHLITQKGRHWLEITNQQSAQTVRKECRKGENLSTHFLKYRLTIEEKNNFSVDRLNELPLIKPVKPLNALKNNPILYCYCEDATIIIHKKTIFIRIHDVVTSDVDDMHFETFNKALGYVEKLEKTGLVVGGMVLEPAHYARVNGLLGQLLKKIDDRFFLDLGNGRKLWIDNSTGPVEDETTDPEVRNKLDNLMKDVVNSEHRFSDIDKIIKALGMIAEIEGFKIIKSRTEDLVSSGEIKTPDYMG